MLRQPAATVTAKAAMTAAWNALPAHISRRRSARSTIAPLSSEHSSHGSEVATVTSETSNGSWVRRAAVRGSAMSRIPSPVAEIVVAAHTRR